MNEQYTCSVIGVLSSLKPMEVNMSQIILNKGGTDEQVIDSSEINVPDLWHIAMALNDVGDQCGSDMILDCWYLAHSLKQHIQYRSGPIKFNK